jgi:hypothetical protein
MSPFGREPVSFPHPAMGPGFPNAPATPRPPGRPALPDGAAGGPIPTQYAPPAQLKKRRWWRFPIWPLLVAGYSTSGRAFAYLGVPPLFIGELYLLGSVYQNRHNWLGRFVDGTMKGRLLPLSIMLLVLWGLFEVARPVLEGASIKEALRTCAFNYYPVFILIGIAIGRDMTLQGFIRFWKGFSAFYAIYSILYVVVGGELGAPWKPDTLLFAPPALAAFVPVGTMAMWGHLRGWAPKWLILPLSMIPIFFSSGRGAVLGLLVGIFAVAMTSLRRFMLVSGLMGVLILLMVIIGPAIKGEAGRAENLHPIINFARLIATFDEDIAYRMLMDFGFTQAADDMIVAKGTSLWRKQIWENIMGTLNTTPLLAMGHGHGEPITDLTPDGQEIHTPHNFVFYALYYTGVIGLALFSFVLLALLLASRRIIEPNIRALQIGHIFMMVLVAAVGNMFETPIAAIPFYLLSGIMIGLPLYVTGRDQYA